MKNQIWVKDGTKDAFFIIEKRSFVIIEASAGALNLYGQPETYFENKSLEDLSFECDKSIICADGDPYASRIIRRHKAANNEEFLTYLSLDAACDESDKIRCSITPIHATNQVDHHELRNSDLISQHLYKSELGIIHWQRNLKLSEWSDQMVAISGLKADDVLGSSIFDLNFVGSEKINEVKKTLFCYLEKEYEKFHIETFLAQKDSVQKRVKLNFSVVWDDNRCIESIMCFVEDKTDAYQKDLRIKESELRYRTLFDSSTEGVLIYKDGHFFDCNERATQLFGCSKDEIVGQSPVFFSPEFQKNGERSDKMAMNYIQKAIETGQQTFEWSHSKLDGTVIDTEVSLVAINIEGQTYIQSIIKDLTSRNDRETRIRKSEKLFRSLFENSSNAIVMVDDTNKVEMINSSFKKLFGYDETEIIGEDIDAVIVPDDEYEEAPKMPALGMSQIKLTKEVVRLNKFGERKHLILSAIPVYLNEKPFKGYGIYIDITDLKEKERTLKQSLYEKQLLLGEIHHRVKNNLALVTSLIQLQSYEVKDAQLIEILSNCEGRIRSIATVHELLYKSESFSHIPSVECIHKIVKQIQQMDDKADITTDVEELQININQAITLGLLLNEILVDAINRRSQIYPQIHLVLKRDGDQIMISIKYGECAPVNELRTEESKKFNSTLINTLLQQLEAEQQPQLDGYGGQIIRFRMSDEKGSASYSL
ncbi:PAS domain S-box protein [Balneola vulgaris]|uniref:PAS domain S-box protein n=1 Tax=Balneola vulgaris TaxID=287535 RepID=UPI00036C2919|nr:PAS domain S-box protein [Balneola vulgaris]